MSLPTDPADPAGMMLRAGSTPDDVQLEYDAVLAAAHLGAAHQADEQAAVFAEQSVERHSGASVADILAAWRASNTARREAMLMTHKRGDNLIAAINLIFDA